VGRDLKINHSNVTINGNIYVAGNVYFDKNYPTINGRIYYKGISDRQSNNIIYDSNKVEEFKKKTFGDKIKAPKLRVDQWYKNNGYEPIKIGNVVGYEKTIKRYEDGKEIEYKILVYDKEKEDKEGEISLLGNNGTFKGLIFAPNITLKLGNNCTLEGIFIVKDIKSGNSLNINYKSMEEMFPDLKPSDYPFVFEEEGE
jgi:hypothetical protein